MFNILQTFYQIKGNDNPLLNNGGFLCPEIHWMAWALSCLQLRKFYPNVKLHANQLGKEILVDTLSLPYTQVHLSLENDFMQNLHPKMWAYAKIHTYSLQTESFLHVDGDVFIWKAFDESLIQSGLIAQNLENNLDIYYNSITAIEKFAEFKPDWLTHSKSHPKAYNAGILGGADLAFIKEYTDLAFEFYEKNKLKLEVLTTEDRNINCIAEQYLFYVLSEKQNKRVSVFTNHEIVLQEDFGEFIEVDKIPFEKQYLHTLGGFKKPKSINDFISFALLTEYPEYWYKIISLFRKGDILSDYMQRLLQMQNPNQKKILPQFILENEKFRNSKSLCEVLDVNFENGSEQGFENKIIKNAFELDKAIISFEQKEFQKFAIPSNPFPLYSKPTNVLEQKDFFDHYLFLTPYHEVVPKKYEFEKIITNNPGFIIKDLNPINQYVILFLDVNTYSSNQLVVTDLFLKLLEDIKSKPITVKEIVKKQNESEVDKIFEILKTWYAYGFIYFSKSKKDFIPQKPSEVYVQHQHNLNTQISTCFKKVLDHYQITDYKEKLITQFDFSKKNISLHDIIKVFEKLNFETKGVRGDLESLSQIPLPAVALVKLREYVSLYVLITKVTATHVTIFNTELNEEEDYQLDYFTTIWDGILILMLPKTK